MTEIKGKPLKKKRRPATKTTTELKELKKMNGLLAEIKDILDQTWRGRLPQ